MLDLSLVPIIPEHAPRKVSVLPGLALSRAVNPRSLLIPAFLLLVFALMPLMMLSTDRDAMLSVRSTVTVSGQVSQMGKGRACNGESIEVQYSFTAGDVEYRGQDTACTQSGYANLVQGDAVPVVYLVDDPSVNAIAGSLNNAPPIELFLVFPLFGLAFFGPLFWPRVSQALRDRRLFQRGTLASGVVVFASKRQDVSWPGWPGSTRSDIHISIQHGSSRSEVVAQCSNDWLLSHLPPGANVTVVYDSKTAKAMLVENYIR